MKTVVAGLGNVIKRSTLSLVLACSFVAATLIDAPQSANAQIGFGISVAETIFSAAASARARRRASAYYGGSNNYSNGGGSGRGSSSSDSRSNREAREYNRAVEICNRGNRMFRQKEYNKALSYFRESLDMHPGLYESQWGMVISNMELRQWDDALAALHEIKSNKHDSDYWFALAESDKHLHRFEQASQAYGHFLSVERHTERADSARRMQQIIEENFLAHPSGDYYADATADVFRRWPGKDNQTISLNVFIDEDPAVGGYKPEFAQTLRGAFQEWSEVSNGKINFNFTDKRSDAQITCGWTDDQSSLGSGDELGITHTKFSGDHTIASADIKLYTMKDETKLNLDELVSRQSSVSLHEIGHALGLDHSKKPYDIMYFQVAPQGLEFHLSTRDKNTILAVYARPTNDEVARAEDLQISSSEADDK